MTNEDVIRREDVINLVHKLAQPCDDRLDWDISADEMIDGIKSLPPVTPQTKVGYWVETELVDTGVSKFSCSVCKEGDFYNQIDNPFIPTKYCPNCGAYMAESEG